MSDFNEVLTQKKVDDYILLQKKREVHRILYIEFTPIENDADKPCNKREIFSLTFMKALAFSLLYSILMLVALLTLSYHM